MAIYSNLANLAIYSNLAHSARVTNGEKGSAPARTWHSMNDVQTRTRDAHDQNHRRTLEKHFTFTTKANKKTRTKMRGKVGQETH